MTISKKLFLVATLGLNCTPFVSAYDVVGLKDEIQLISAFVNQHNTGTVDGEIIDLNYWLNNKINSTWTTSNSKILEIANIIKQNYIHHSSAELIKTCEELFEMMEKEQKNRNERIVLIMAMTLEAGAALGIMSLMTSIQKHQCDHWSLNYSVKYLTNLVDEQQQQINDLTQQVNKTCFQKLFAK